VRQGGFRGALVGLGRMDGRDGAHGGYCIASEESSGWVRSVGSFRGQQVLHFVVDGG
jgi:hypothetical protein